MGVDKLRLLRTYARAVRNCPWSVELWMRYAVATEVTVREQLLDGGTNGLDAIQHNDMENQALAKIEGSLLIFRLVLFTRLFCPAIFSWRPCVNLLMRVIRTYVRISAQLVIEKPCKHYCFPVFVTIHPGGISVTLKLERECRVSDCEWSNVAAKLPRMACSFVLDKSACDLVIWEL